jgi:hypothetical protein
MHMVAPIRSYSQTNDWCDRCDASGGVRCGALCLCLCGPLSWCPVMVSVWRARAAQNCSCHFWCTISDFPALFLTNLSHRRLQHDIHHRSPHQIIIHSEHENSRVGQIASRSDRDRQGHSIRRAAQPAPFTTHFCSSHTCPSSFDQLRPACPSLAGISPVSPVSHRYLIGISSFRSPSGSRCTAAGARSHSPCGP